MVNRVYLTGFLKKAIINFLFLQFRGLIFGSTTKPKVATNSDGDRIVFGVML